jgi:hypothetical protein
MFENFPVQVPTLQIASGSFEQRDPGVPICSPVVPLKKILDDGTILPEHSAIGMVYGSYTSVMDAIVYGYKPELDLAN